MESLLPAVPFPDELQELSEESLFASVAKPLPTEVEVIGAGVHDVNGVYTLVPKGEDEYASTGRYVKMGPPGEGVEVMHVVEVDHGSREWILRKKQPKINASDNLYSHPLARNISDGRNASQIGLGPPIEGWKTSLSGKFYRYEPVPIVVPVGSNPPLNWRVDPDISVSDQEIVVSDGQSEKEYNVHRNVMVTGTKTAEYFKAHWQSSGFADSGARISHLQLAPAAAFAFPVMLDFLYGSKLRIHDDNAVALLHLAYVFGCDAMLKKVKAFLANSMRIEVTTTDRRALVIRFGKFYRQGIAVSEFDVARLVAARVAMKMQAAWRGKLARKAYHPLLAEATRKRALEEAAAVTIQSLLRGRLAQNGYRRALAEAARTRRLKEKAEAMEAALRYIRIAQFCKRLFCGCLLRLVLGYAIVCVLEVLFESP